MGLRIPRSTRAIWSVAVMLLGAGNCGHSCGPNVGSFGGDQTPFKATCRDMAEGRSCPTLNDTTCEERNHSNPACNTIWKCEAATQVWKARPPLHADCATHCPTTFDAGAVDAPCAVPNASTLICDYLEGTCGCVPVGGAADGGARGFEWRCTNPASECSWKRPYVGSHCFGDLVCDYGDCSFPDGVRVRCAQEEWVLEDTCGP